MAVYRGLDIGTAKPTPQEQARVPHHVIDVVAPSESYSVARWLADAGRAVDAIRLRGNKILFVGGTPLYFRSVRDGLALLPEGDPELRCELLAEAALSSPLALHAKLATIDPRAAARLHPNDTRRIVRIRSGADYWPHAQRIVLSQPPSCVHHPDDDSRYIAAVADRTHRATCDGNVFSWFG